MVSELQKIELFLQALAYAFSKLNVSEQVAAISIVVIFIASFYVLIISPMIFNYILIPKIEKKVGMRLSYLPYLDQFWGGNFIGRQVEISQYIIHRYWAFKFKGDEGLPLYSNRISLKKVGYTIKIASKAEIFFSFMLWISTCITLAGVVIFFVASAFMPPHISK